MSCKHLDSDGRCRCSLAHACGRTVTPGVCAGCEHRDGDCNHGDCVPPTPEEIAAYRGAELSLLTQGPVPAAVYEHRVRQCRHRAVDPADGREYCKSCSCGPRRRAKLKMHMPDVSCDRCGIEPQSGEGLRAMKRLGGWRRQFREILADARDLGLTRRAMIHALFGRSRSD